MRSSGRSRIGQRMQTEVEATQNHKEKKGEREMFKNFDELPSVLDMKELSVFLGISRAGAYNLLHRTDFPTLHINSRLLVTKENLRAWMEKNTNGTM